MSPVFSWENDDPPKPVDCCTSRFLRLFFFFTFRFPKKRWFFRKGWDSIRIRFSYSFPKDSIRLLFDSIRLGFDSFCVWFDSDLVELFGDWFDSIRIRNWFLSNRIRFVCDSIRCGFGERLARIRFRCALGLFGFGLDSVSFRFGFGLGSISVWMWFGFDDYA